MNCGFRTLGWLAGAYALMLSPVCGQELTKPDSFLDTDPVVKSSGAEPTIEIMALETESGTLSSVAAIADYPIINSPEVSPDGEWIAVDGWKRGERLTDARLLLVHRKTGIVSDLGLGAMPSWSPDGRWLAWSRYSTGGSPGGVFIGRVNGQREKQVHEGGWAITWAPVGQKVVYIRGGDLVTVDFKSKSGHLIFGEEESPYRRIMHNPKWSPDGSRICFMGVRADGTKEFATVAAAGDAELQICCDAQNFNPDIGWSTDGRRLTFPHVSAPGRPAQIWVYDIESQDPPSPLSGQPTDRNNSGNDWAPDGKTLYFVSSP